MRRVSRLAEKLLASQGLCYYSVSHLRCLSTSRGLGCSSRYSALNTCWYFHATVDSNIRCLPPRVLLRTSTFLSAYLHVSCCVTPRALLRTSTCLLGDSPRRDMLEVSRLRSDNNWPPGCESKSCVAVEANESERSTHRATWEQSTRNQSVAARSISSSACSTVMSSVAGTEHPL